MATPFETVDEYIATFPPDVQEILQQVRQAIHAGVPDAPEKIRYSMAAVMIDERRAINFAGWKRFVGLYPVPRLDPALEAEIAPYRVAKDSVNFAYSRPIPVALITRVSAAIAALRR